MKKNQIARKALTLTLLSTILVTTMILLPVSATDIPFWDVSGTYPTDVIYLGVTYKEELFLVQDGSDITDGYIQLVGGGSRWTITSGSVSANTIEFYGYFNPNPTMTIHFSGNIASDGSMSGDWADEAPGTRIGTWETTEGSAEPYIITLEFPQGTEVDVSVEIIEEGNLPPCTPALPEGVTPYIAVQIIEGEFDGVVKVGVRYDDIWEGEEEEENLRLYMSNCVDFNLDGTINGQDLALIKKAIDAGPEVTHSTLGVPFDVNNDGEVNNTDVEIVHIYMTQGLIVNEGIDGMEQARLPWIDITVEVDAENNIVYGETDHFSIFRCR